MSTKYKEFSEVPTVTLGSRLAYLSDVFAHKKGNIDNEITMRVPAELDRDVDLVCLNSANRLLKLQTHVEQLQAENVALRIALTDARDVEFDRGLSENLDKTEKALSATPQTKLLADLIETGIKVDRIHGWHCTCEHCEKHGEAVRAYQQGRER